MKGGAFGGGCIVRWINEVLDASHAWSTVRRVSTASIVKRNVLRRWENLIKHAGSAKAGSVDEHSRQDGIGVAIAPFGVRRGLDDPTLCAFRGRINPYR